jgi:hypothetical protein
MEGGCTHEPFLEGAHSRELAVYAAFARLDPGLRMPRLYHGAPYRRQDRTGVAIMEDLSDRATTVRVLPAGLTHGYYRLQ